MALKEPLMVKYVEVRNATSVSLLTPSVQEAYKIKSLQLTTDISDSATDQAFCTLKIDRTTIGFYRVGSTVGNHLRWETEVSRIGSLFTYLVKKDVLPPIPLQQGETFILEFNKPYTGGILAEYEIWEPNDVNTTSPLGSQATEMYYILYGRNASDITANGYYEITDVWNPVEFIKAPFGEKVPAGYVIEILACLAQDVGRYIDASNSAETTFLRFIRGNTELFDKDRQGFILKGSYPATAGYYYGLGHSYFNYHKFGTQGEIKFFPKALTLSAGEELKIFVGVNVAGTNGKLEAKTVDVPLLIHLKRAG